MITANALLRACLLSAFLCSTRLAMAVVCPPIAPTVYVGDIAHDANCTYGSIAEALTGIGTNTCHVNIVVNASYTNQHIDIQDKNVSIIGSALACGTPPPVCTDPTACGSSPSVPTAPVHSLSATGNGGDSVFTIHGASNVTIENLLIKDAQLGSGSHGGGINFDGQGSLMLVTDTISGNQAQYGGGIAFKGSSGTATLTIGDHTMIENNTANSDGGGINIEANATLNFSGSESIISSNHAGRYGGGVEVFGDAYANISSPGLGTLAAIYNNDAADGGGVAVNSDGGTTHNTNLTIYTTDPSRPVAIAWNSATDAGGGVYLKSYTDPIVGTYATFCAYDFNLSDNSAPDGSAVYGTDDFITFVGLNRAVSTFDGTAICASSRPSAGVACNPQTKCNTVSDNVSENSSGNATGTVLTFNALAGKIAASRVSFTHNFGQHLVFTDNNLVAMDDCIVADNETSLELISAVDASNVDLSNCTVVDNVDHSTYLLNVDGTFKLHESIVYQPTTTILHFSGDGSDLHTNYSLVSDTQNMDATTLQVGQPLFMNGDQGDYRLYAACQSWTQDATCPAGELTASPGIDAVPVEDSLPLDVGNRTRNRDVPAILGPNATWTRDIGAYEMQQITDRIFASGFGDPVLLVN